MTIAMPMDAVDGQARRLSVEAMATRFELVYCGPLLAGEETLAEITRLEARLGADRAESDVAWINAHAGLRAVTVEPRTFTLLQRCVELSEETDGAFDITVGPLLQAWRLVGEAGTVRGAESLADARSRVGYRHLHLDPAAASIRFGRTGMRLDLGAAARGYAIDAAMTVLRSHGVQSALLRAGVGSVRAIGESGGGPWTITWEPEGSDPRPLRLRDSAVSVSPTSTLAVDGRPVAQTFNPILGLPADAAPSAVVTGPSSLECEALSTALLVLGRDWLPELRRRFPGYDGDVA